jgi:hypothetical protein
VAIEAAEGSVTTEGTVGDEGLGDESLIVEGESTAGETSEAATGSEEEPELYVVKVGGKEERVSLDELTNGYQRQQDYTRKTQELAQQRQEISQMLALQAALERDPQTTLAALAGALGVNLGPTQAPQAPTGEGADPFEVLAREVEGVKGLLTQQQQAAAEQARLAQANEVARQQVDREIANLKATHGDFDERELARYAVENQSPNLALAFNAWQYELSQQREIAERNRATEAKRRAQVVAGGGTGANAGSTAPAGAGGLPSLREALRMALSSHGS